MEGVKSRFRGSLLGLAIGDALGMPFEGQTPELIRKVFKEARFVPASFRGLSAGQFTDDTKMTLCHLESLIEVGEVDPEDIAQKFLAWFASGDWRGIGGTTLRAMRRLASKVPAGESGISGKYAAGNGGAMRIAPVGLFYTGRLEALRQGVEKAVVITHNNEEAVEGAVAVAYLVARGAERGWSGLREIQLFEELLDFLRRSEVRRNLERAFCIFKEERLSPSKTAQTLGNSGYVVESVATAIYTFFFHSKDFEKALFEAVLCGGDTDTIASMTGAISGAFLGEEALPLRLKEEVEEGEEIARKADLLFEVWRGRGSVK